MKDTGIDWYLRNRYQILSRGSACLAVAWLLIGLLNVWTGFTLGAWLTLTQAAIWVIIWVGYRVLGTKPPKKKLPSRITPSDLGWR